MPPRSSSVPVVWLGPQRFRPCVKEVLHELDVRGRVAVITAGWEEREDEVEELDAHLDGRAVPLRVHALVEAALDHDPSLHEAWRARNEAVREIRDVYRYRLDFVLEPALELLRRRGPEVVLASARRSAIRAVRTLDAGFLRQVDAEHREFARRWADGSRPAVRRTREILRERLDGCEALAIAGGHVDVLWRCLAFLDFVHGFEGPIVAWGAGAMALSERIVLFHDRPPQGAGNAELLGRGLGLVRGAVALPDARRRLTLDDPARVAMLAQRFKPAVAYGMPEGARVDFDRDGAAPGSEALVLSSRGRTRPGAAA